MANKYELRKLEAGDIFPMFNIISKIGVKELKGCFESEDVKTMVAGKSDVNAIGAKVLLDVAGIIICNISSAEQDIYSFLSGLSGMSKEEIKKLDMATFAEMIITVFKKEEFKDFFQVVSELFK